MTEDKKERYTGLYVPVDLLMETVPLVLFYTNY